MLSGEEMTGTRGGLPEEAEVEAEMSVLPLSRSRSANSIIGSLLIQGAVCLRDGTIVTTGAVTEAQQIGDEMTTMTHGIEIETEAGQGKDLGPGTEGRGTEV